MRKALLALILTGLVPACLMAESGGGVEFSRDAEAVAYTHTTNVGDYERFSFQVIYTTAAPSAATVSDGAFASATLTVADYAALNGQGAYGTITLADGKNTTAIDDAVITLGSKRFVEGIHWDRLAISTMTMASLQAAIDADWEYSATVSSNVVTVTYYKAGTSANTYALTASTGVLSCSAATLGSGQPYGYLSISGTTLTEGTDWDAATSSATTAGNIAAAINADTTISSIVSASTTSLGVVTVTAKLSGDNHYPISVSNATYLVPSKVAVTGGTASDVSVSADTFYESSNGFSVGLPVLFSTVTASTPPTGLTNQTTYYVIPVTENTFQVADVSTNAVAGTEIDITAVAGGGSFTFTPITFSAGSAGFKWQGSNDGSNFVDLSVSSVTYSVPGDDLWSFSDYTYKYIRLYYTGPTYGGIDLDGIIHWRKE